MGRMADARKRARRGGGPTPEAPEGPTEAAAPLSTAEPIEVTPGPGERAERPPAPPKPSAPGAPASDFLFPAEPVEEASRTKPERLTLPSSGLASEILPRVHVEISGTSRTAPGVPGRIELPASGLAEDILPRQDVADVSPADRVPAAPTATAPTETGPTVPAGAHSLSFFAAPVHEQRAAVEATEHLATFFLDREEYGVDVKQVQEIRRLSEITPVPRAPQFVRGVINLRGRILPVLDLRAKLGLGEVAEDKATRIIVVRVKERILGLLVDGASQVLKIPLSRIEPAPEEIVER
jgi:purine-binding chemotaxis protein CheW